MTKVKARKDKVMTDDRRRRRVLARGHGQLHADPRARALRPIRTPSAVDDLILQADKIFLNVGGRAVVPDMPGLADVDYMTNVGILDLDTVPEHLVIIGGSYIALEFAQMYRRFGAEVTVIEKGPRLTSREDEDVSAAIKEILEKEGIAIELDATAISFRKQDNGFEVTPRDGAHPIAGSHLLVAIGRRPNTDDLGLENAGVETDARGNIVVDDQCRTNVDPHLGDGRLQRQAARSPTPRTTTSRSSPPICSTTTRAGSATACTTYALYIDPPLGRAGMTVDQVRESGRKALVGKRPMTRVGRAVEKGETQGFMKVVVDADTKEILGAAILGVGGDEVVHAILDVMTAKLPYTAISRTMHIHPTVSELVPTMLQEMTPLDRGCSCRVTSATRRPSWRHVATSEGAPVRAWRPRRSARPRRARSQAC